MRRRQAPRPISEALSAVRAEVEPQTPLARLQGVWTEAMGETIAAAARPVADRGGVITIACTAATWAQELDLLRDELLARLRERLGEGAPRELRFVVGDGRYSNSPADDLRPS